MEEQGLQFFAIAVSTLVVLTLVFGCGLLRNYFDCRRIRVALTARGYQVRDIRRLARLRGLLSPGIYEEHMRQYAATCLDHDGRPIEIRCLTRIDLGVWVDDDTLPLGVAAQGSEITRLQAENLRLRAELETLRNPATHDD